MTKVLFCLLAQLLLTHKLVNSIEGKSSTITLRVHKPSHSYDNKNVYSNAFLQADNFSFEKRKGDSEEKGYKTQRHDSQQFYDLLIVLNRSTDLPTVITPKEGKRNTFHQSSISPNGPNLDTKSVITQNAPIFQKQQQRKKMNHDYHQTNRWHKTVPENKGRQVFYKSSVNGDISKKHYRSRRHALLASILKPPIVSEFINGLPSNLGYLQGELGRSLGKTIPYSGLTVQGIKERFGSDSDFSQLYTNPYSFSNLEPFNLFSGYGHQVQQHNFGDLSSNFDFTLEDFGLEDPEDSYTEFVIAENEKFQPKPIEKDKEEENNPFKTDEYFKHWMVADEYLTKPKETPDPPQKESNFEEHPPSVSQNKMLPEKEKEKVQVMMTSEKEEKKEQITADRDNSEISVKVNYNVPLSNVETSPYHHTPPLAIFFGFHPLLKGYTIDPKEMAKIEKKEEKDELPMKQSPVSDTSPHTYQPFQGYDGENHYRPYDQQKSPHPPEKRPQSHSPRLSKFQHNLYLAGYNDKPKQPSSSIKMKTNTKEMPSNQNSPALIKMMEKEPEKLSNDQQSYLFSDYNMKIKDVPSSQQSPTALKVNMKPGVLPSYQQVLPPTYYNNDHQPSFKINTMLENPFSYQHDTFLPVYNQEPQEHPYIINSNTKPKYEQHFAPYDYNGFPQQLSYSFSNMAPDGSLNFKDPSPSYDYNNDYPQLTYVLDKIIQSEGLPVYQNSPPTSDYSKTIKETQDSPKMITKSELSPNYQLSSPSSGYNNGSKQPPPSSEKNLESDSPPSYQQHSSRFNDNNEPRDNANKPQQEHQLSEENKPKPSEHPRSYQQLVTNQQQKTSPQSVGLSQRPYICYQCSPLYGNFLVHQSPTPISKKLETQQTRSY